MQIDYTSRDFAGLKADLISLIGDRTNTSWDPTNYNDLGHVLVEAFSYMGDIMSHYLDRVANETTIDTAIQTDSLLALAQLYDYKISGPTPAIVSVTFTNVSSNAVDLPLGTQVMAPLSYGPYASVYFETTQAATAIAAGASITLPAIEGKTVNTDRPDLIDSTYNKPLPANLGTSSGVANQSFGILDIGVVDTSINVYVGQSVAFTLWKYVDNLLEYGPGDTVFTTSRTSDGTMNIVFGDNVNGAIPPSGQLISCLYKTSTGAAGNVISSAITELTFMPGNLDPQAPTYFTVYNALPASGGADGDDLYQIKTKTKAAIAAKGRAVTTADYANLALMVPQVGKANAAASVYSSVRLYIQPQNDGSAAPGFAQATIANTVGSGTAVTYTTTTAHAFSIGDTVTISGMNPSVYNLSNATVTAISTTSPYSFTVASTLTNTFVSGGLAIDSTPTAAWTSLSSAVSTYLADKMIAGTTLSVLPPSYVPIYLSATVNVSPSYKNSDIKLAIYQAMLGSGGLFYYDNNTFGDTIPYSSVSSAIANVPGVLSVNITQLNTDGGSSAATISLAANQIPFLTASNLVTTATGGI